MSSHEALTAHVEQLRAQGVQVACSPGRSARWMMGSTWACVAIDSEGIWAQVNGEPFEIFEIFEGALEWLEAKRGGLSGQRGVA